MGHLDNLWSDVMHLCYTHCAIETTPCHALLAQGNPAVWRCSGPLEAHHVIPKATTIATRWDPKIGIMLCRRHHQSSPYISPHSGAPGFHDWLRVYRPDQYEYCRHVLSELYAMRLPMPDVTAVESALLRIKAAGAEEGLELVWPSG
jgi:hypothetical protein